MSHSTYQIRVVRPEEVALLPAIENAAAVLYERRKGTVLDEDGPRSLGTHLAEECPSSPQPVHFEDRPLSPSHPERGEGVGDVIHLRSRACDLNPRLLHRAIARVCLDQRASLALAVRAALLQAHGRTVVPCPEADLRVHFTNAASKYRTRCEQLVDFPDLGHDVIGLQAHAQPVTVFSRDVRGFFRRACCQGRPDRCVEDARAARRAEDLSCQLVACSTRSVFAQPDGNVPTDDIGQWAVVDQM